MGERIGGMEEGKQGRRKKGEERWKEKSEEQPHESTYIPWLGGIDWLDAGCGSEVTSSFLLCCGFFKPLRAVCMSPVCTGQCIVTHFLSVGCFSSCQKQSVFFQ